MRDFLVWLFCCIRNHTWVYQFDDDKVRRCIVCGALEVKDDKEEWHKARRDK